MSGRADHIDRPLPFWGEAPLSETRRGQLREVSREAAPAEGPVQTGARGATVSLRGVVKSFGGKPVIQGLDLDLNPGEFVVIVGKSGCGKSTLLRLISGLETADAGSITARRADGATASTRFVFQEPRLLPWARVGDNVAVGLVPDTARERTWPRVVRALTEVGLADRIGDWPSVLSGGQKQRVALARALVSAPDLMLLDEPLGALDALTRITMQSLIGDVWRHLGFSALLVTHDVTEAVALADRVIVLDHGRIALDLSIDLPRPRPRGDAAFARLEGILLDAIFGASAFGL